MWCHFRKSNYCHYYFSRESHCHPLEDCSPIRTATWQHKLQLLQLSPPVLQPPRWLETTASTALGLGCDSTLIRSRSLSHRAKICWHPDRLAVQTRIVNCPNRGAENQVQCLTVTVSKASPSRRLFHQRTLSRVLLMSCKTYVIWWKDLINHLLHNRLSFLSHAWWILGNGHTDKFMIFHIITRKK